MSDVNVNMDPEQLDELIEKLQIIKPLAEEVCEFLHAMERMGRLEDIEAELQSIKELSEQCNERLSGTERFGKIEDLECTLQSIKALSEECNERLHGIERTDVDDLAAKLEGMRDALGK